MNSPMLGHALPRQVHIITFIDAVLFQRRQLLQTFQTICKRRGLLVPPVNYYILAATSAVCALLLGSVCRAPKERVKARAECSGSLLNAMNTDARVTRSRARCTGEGQSLFCLTCIVDHCRYHAWQYLCVPTSVGLSRSDASSIMQSLPKVFSPSASLQGPHL